MCGSAEDTQLGRRGDLAPDRAGDGALRRDDIFTRTLLVVSVNSKKSSC